MVMMSEQEAVRDAIVAFAKLHNRYNCKLGVRGIDRGELNLNDMKCVRVNDDAWICTLPHIHLPLVTLTYEFTYTTKHDLRQAAYSCSCITPILEIRREIAVPA
jgi:hypothetical protein